LKSTRDFDFVIDPEEAAVFRRTKRQRMIRFTRAEVR
jgi:hypothetical protein